MGLFKSAEERRMEREIRIRQGIRQIEKAIRQQARFQGEFISNARRARQIGDQAQYQFIRNALKKTATVRKMLQRQLLAIRNALLIKQQAEANAAFAQSMNEMAREISRIFGATDLAGAQARWERAIAQSQTLQQRMELFLESIEQLAEEDVALAEPLVSDEELDRMIDTEVLAAEQQELDSLRGLAEEIDAELDKGEQTGREG